jgi:hypothetical protein
MQLWIRWRNNTITSGSSGSNNILCKANKNPQPNQLGVFIFEVSRLAALLNGETDTPRLKLTQ